MVEVKFETKGENVSKGDAVSTTLSDKWISSEKKRQWLSQAGISEKDYIYADYIVGHESSWNPEAVNKSSGSCGLAQALPCSKIGNDWKNPVVALKWMNSYVVSRYKSWQNAYNFWISHKWY